MEIFDAVFLSMPGGMEWVLIVLVIVLLFGGRKIPELMKGLGEGINEFKKAKDGHSDTSAKPTEKEK
jgi:sec-independent protein translocase protein TatA